MAPNSRSDNQSEAASSHDGTVAVASRKDVNNEQDSRVMITAFSSPSLSPESDGDRVPRETTTEENNHHGIVMANRNRKRDVVRQVSLRLYLKVQDLAEDVLRNIQLQRMETAERVCMDKNSSLQNQIPSSRKAQARKHLWLPKTQDDSVLLQGSSSASSSSSSSSCSPPVNGMIPSDHREVRDFFLSRVTDPTSYFYRFHFDNRPHLAPRKAEVQLVDITWLKPHEQVVSWERVNGLKKATLSWDAYTEPLLVDLKTGAILDGHHRYNVALQLCLKQVPAVLVDYLGDPTIGVDVWPGCGRTSLTKEEVIEMSLSPHVFPPKTSRHRFTESLPPISIPLSVLRQAPRPLEVEETTTVETKNTSALTASSSKFKEASINLIFGAQNLAVSVVRGLFRSRLRTVERAQSRTQLDITKHPAVDAADFFNVIRENDPSSSFCRQKSATFEDLLLKDASDRKTFFMARICDPTSYFYRYHFDVRPKRQPKKAHIQLASLNWLKAHEHVVSWERVEGLKRATERWNAYLEPLLVDSKTGAILDGHHRYHVGLHLCLKTVPVVLVDYLSDASITVDVWPNSCRDTLTKAEVIDMSLSEDLFPPKTSRHTFSDDLPPISIPLDRLRIEIQGHVADV